MTPPLDVGIWSLTIHVMVRIIRVRVWVSGHRLPWCLAIHGGRQDLFLESLREKATSSLERPRTFSNLWFMVSVKNWKISVMVSVKNGGISVMVRIKNWGIRIMVRVRDLSPRKKGSLLYVLPSNQCIDPN